MMKIKVCFYLVTVLNTQDTEWYKAGVENVLAIADSSKDAKEAVKREYSDGDTNYKFVAVKHYRNYEVNYPVAGGVDLTALICEALDENDGVKIAYTVYGDNGGDTAILESDNNA